MQPVFTMKVPMSWWLRSPLLLPRKCFLLLNWLDAANPFYWNSLPIYSPQQMEKELQEEKKHRSGGTCPMEQPELPPRDRWSWP